MEEQHTIPIATTSSSLIGAQIGTQVAQLGAGLIETINLIKMDMLVELVRRGKSQLVIWDQADRLLVIRWQESQLALRSQRRWRIIRTQLLTTS